MSGKTTGKVWDLELPLAQMLVLLAMADKADHNDDNIHPGVPLLAWMTGYSERQVRRIMRQLEAIGLLVATHVIAGKPTVYRIDVSKGHLKPAFESRSKASTPDITVSPHESQTPDIAVSPDIAMSPLTSHGKNILATPDIGTRKTVSNVLKSNGSSSSRSEGSYSSVDAEAYRHRFDYYHAFEAAYPSEAKTKVSDTDRNKNHARELFLANYRLDEVTTLVRQKLADGRADYRFHYLMSDLAQARLERNKTLAPRVAPPEVVNGGKALVPLETDWRREATKTKP